MNVSKLFFLFLLAVLATSCDPDFLGNVPEDVATSQNTLNIRLTDDPIDLDEVNIDLEQVILKGPNGFAELPLGTKAGIYNLLDYQNGLDTLIATATELPFTEIKEIRLVLGSDNTVVVDGVPYDLKIPSGSQSGLKIKVCLDLSTTEEVYDLILDFDAEASIHQTGNGKYIMKPVIRVLNPDAKCSGEDNDYDDEDEDVPVSILDWLKDKYDGFEYEPNLGTFCDEDLYIVKATKDEEVFYVYFDLDGNFLQEGIVIDNADLPAVITADIETAFSGYTLQGAPTFEIVRLDGKVCYQVRVEKDETVMDLVYEEDGTYVCQKQVDEDDEYGEGNEDEDEGDKFIPLDDLPTDVLDYLNDNYPDLDFTALPYTFCDGTEFYLVAAKEASSSILLYYDQDWELIQQAKGVDAKDLPDAVVASINVDYSGYKLMNDRAWEIIRADGETWYRAHLKKNNSGDKIYIIYTADGTFICQED